MKDLADLGLVEAADAIMAREITSTELLEAYLKRLDAVNPTLNATIWVDRDRARGDAFGADSAMAAGRAKGRLFGIPLEGVGFSNDAKIRMSPPKFEEAAFPHGATDQRITFKLRYFV